MILLLDASFLEGVIAWLDQGEVIKEDKIPLGPLAEEDLAVYLQEYLKEKITGLALGVGPGSYTGMRVAAALLLPLAYARKLPLVTFCSLQGISLEKPVVSDGKRGFFYVLEEGQVSVRRLEELKDNFVSPQALKKIYPSLEGRNIEHAAFKAENVLPTIKEKWEKREFELPEKVKLHYLQQAG